MTKAEAMAEFKIMSLSPLKRWCKLYRTGGAEALKPKPKEDLKVLRPSHRNAPANRNLRSAAAGSRPK